MKSKWQIVLPVVLMLAFALTRWPGLLPNNFSAAYALAFCAGVYFPRCLIWLPLATMLLTDILLNVFHYHTAPIRLRGPLAGEPGKAWLSPRPQLLWRLADVPAGNGRAGVDQ